MARGPLTLAPEVDELRRQFEQMAAEADALVTPLGDAQFTWRPTPRAWSVADCLDHLNATARLYLPRLDESIADAIRRGRYGAGPYRYAWIGRLLVHLTEPPPRFRTEAPPGFHPAPNRSRHDVMAAFRAYQIQFIDRLRQANGLDLARARVSPPMTTWIRISLGSGFLFVLAHERRHLWQARQVLQVSSAPT
jgi:hypothetical protein